VDTAGADKSTKPLMPYASHVAAGTGRTPIGIIMFAASHLLLGGTLFLTAGLMFRSLVVWRARAGWEDWLVAGLVALAAVPMVVGAVMLLLKGTIAWTAAVASFTVLAIFEAIAIAYSISMTVRYVRQGNNDVQWAGIFFGMSMMLAFLCRVVVGYLGGEKARATFGLPSGDPPGVVKMLPRMVMALYTLALIAGPMFSGVRWLFPD
jgi:hypothetical protein